MISQERKNELKNEGENEELKEKILIYDFYDKILRLFPRFAAANLIILFIIFGIHQFSDRLNFFAGYILYANIYVFGGYCILYAIIVVLLQWIFIRSLKKLSQPMACYAAVSAAEQLENDNLIEASFCADKLLGALSFLVKQESIEVKSWESSLKNLLYVKPGDIKNKAVHGAIQDSTATKNDFAEQFYALADSLSKDSTSREYMVIRDFLKWLSEMSQNYESGMGFWERHQNYRSSLDIIAITAPIIVAILMLLD